MFKESRDAFGYFCWKRFVRLYVPTYLITLFYFIIGYYRLSDYSSLRRVFRLLIWPTKFWFVSAVFVFSIVLFFIAKTGFLKKPYRFAIYTIVWWGICLLVYCIGIPNKNMMIENVKIAGTSIHFRCLYSFYMYTLGYYLRVIDGKWADRKDDWLFWCAFVISLFTLYGFKMVLKTYPSYMRFQLLCQAITTICVASLFIALKKRFRIHSLQAKRVITSLSTITLELYLVQMAIIKAIATTDIAFPINYLAATVLILLSSYGFHFINNTVCNMILKH